MVDRQIFPKNLGTSLFNDDLSDPSSWTVPLNRENEALNGPLTILSLSLCAADFSLLNLPKGKSLGRSKPATNS